MINISKKERDSIVVREQALIDFLTVKKTNGKSHRRTCYRQEEVSHLNPPTNEERSKVEIYDFIHNPPDKYFAYPSQDFTKIITWMGDTLGNITWKGMAFKSNRGDSRRAFTMHAINGRVYHGTIYNEINCRMKVKKSN